MAENFYTILTDVGKAKLANSQVTGTKVDLVEMAVGDSDGNYYNPTDSQTSLVNEVWRGNIGSIDVDSNNPNWIVIETVIPAEDGGFSVREVGIFDSAGDMIAIGKYPETYKPVLEEGSAKDLYIRMVIEVTNSDSVTIKIDPAIVIASRKYVDDQIEPLQTDIQTLDDRVTSHEAENVTDQYKKSVIVSDENNNPTEVEYRRKSDNTLAIKRHASNPDTNGFYQTVIEEFYEVDGVTKYKTVTYTFTYLENGLIATSDGGVVS